MISWTNLALLLLRQSVPPVYFGNDGETIHWLCCNSREKVGRNNCFKIELSDLRFLVIFTEVTMDEWLNYYNFVMVQIRLPRQAYPWHRKG